MPRKPPKTKRRPRPIRILFLCTGNSCRSQMAEGWARQLLGNSVEALSAGTRPKPLDSRAVEVMAEVGVDISGQRAKNVAELDLRSFDYVVTVCGAAHETCPVLPGGPKLIHAGFDDPPAAARSASSEEEALAHYRRVRDEIHTFVARLPAELKLAWRCNANAEY